MSARSSGPRGEAREAERVRRGRDSGSVAGAFRELDAATQLANRRVDLAAREQDGTELARRRSRLRRDALLVEQSARGFERGNRSIGITRFPQREPEVEERGAAFDV